MSHGQHRPFYSMRRLLPALMIIAAAGRRAAHSDQDPADRRRRSVAHSSRRRTRGSADVSIALADSLLDPFGESGQGIAAERSARSGLVLRIADRSTPSRRTPAAGERFPLGGIARSGSNFGGFVSPAGNRCASVRRSSFAADPGLVTTGRARRSAATGDTVAAKPSSRSRRVGHIFREPGHLRRRERALVRTSRHRRRRSALRGKPAASAARRRARRAARAAQGMERRPRRSRPCCCTITSTMTHDVTWADQVWDPNTRTLRSRARASTTTSTARTRGDCTSATRSRSATRAGASARS